MRRLAMANATVAVVTGVLAVRWFPTARAKSQSACEVISALGAGEESELRKLGAGRPNAATQGPDR